MQATRSVWQNLQRTSTPAPELERAGTALSALVTQLVHNRGITAPTLDEFLTPNRGPTYDPFLLTGMDVAVTRILQARAVGELVAVYGDSDVDGIAAAALLVEALTAAGIRAIPYIPNRQVEAAGTQRDVLNYLQARGASLIITVDCGISSAEEIEAAKLAGLDVIVTDHHAPPANLPSAVSIIDPLQSNCSYPCKHLAGVGVAYKLAQALYRRAGLRDELARLLLDLVAIGTIADMVPLVDENRSLVWHGLRVLNRAARPGIQSLISLAGLRCGTLSASDVCYSLCPRINAAGRIGDGSLGYALLTAQTIDDAEALAALIEERKSERQVLIQQAYAACQQELCRQDARLYDRIIVVHVDPKASSAIGILAGKLAEEYGRPVIVLQPSGDEVRGCVRGTPSFAMLDALRANSDLLMNFGGHQQA
ncbi:MAG: recJ, partial [Chloroflexi bacterium]|nr:recJ [Chloroflexota bacterium]